MGLWDRLLGKNGGKQPPGTSTPSPSPAPSWGRITRFHAQDGLGNVTLDDGTVLKFGRSACKGFDPIESARVRVDETGPHPLGGHRATVITLPDEARAELHSLLDQRDPRIGSIASDDETLGNALALGAITVLLRQVPQPGREGVRQLFQQAGALDQEPQLEFANVPLLHLGHRTAQVFVGRRPFPVDKLDARMCGEGFDPGTAFVTLSLGVPTMDSDSRAVLGTNMPDPWAPGSAQRWLTWVAQKLLQLGVGVVIHRAGNLVFPPALWMNRSLHPLEPECIPFSAWIDLAYSEERTHLRTYGMSISGLPDVAVPISNPDSDDEFHRAQSALLLACFVMTRENRVLRSDETLRVPYGVDIGGYAAYGFPAEDERIAATYWVGDDDNGLLLSPVSLGITPDQAWQAYCDGAEDAPPIPYTVYRELLLRPMRESMEEVASMSIDDPIAGAPRHEVYVFRSPSGFLVMTCGLGRVKQAGGSTDDDSAHLEMVLSLPDHHPAIAAALSSVASQFHARPKGMPPWSPESRVTFDDGPIGPSNHYALGFIRNQALGAGHPVTLLTPVPMTEEEYASVTSDNVQDWLQQHGAEPAVVDRWLALAKQ